MNIDEPIFNSASTLAPQVDKAMLGLLVICGLIFLLLFGLILIFCIRYRKDSTHNRVLKKTQNLALEFSWTIATLIIFLGLFAWGVIIYFEMHMPLSGSSEISVVGKQWMWKLQHQNGHREINEIHIPINQPILLTMTSEDVIHSFFVPEFRIKQDVLPGRYTKTWFEATKLGEYRIYCTQYCGTEHAQMIGKVIVLSDSDYEKWLENREVQSDTAIFESPAKRGEKKFNELACNSCHAIERAGIGPPLKNLVGKRIKFTNGKTIIADESYIRESILYPDAKIVEGYQAVMPSFLGRVSEDDLLDLIAYIKSVSVAKKESR